MQLERFERQRRELLHFVLLVLMMLLGVITYVSFLQHDSLLVPMLTVVSLLACLYAIGKERSLSGRHTQLVEQLVGEQDKSAALETRLKEIASLYRAISMVNSVVEPERTYETVLRAALDLVEGNRGSVMLVEEREQRLVIVAAVGLPEHVVAQTRQRIGDGVAGWVAEQRQPVMLTGTAADDERFQDVVDKEERVSLAICVPLSLRDDIQGVINVGVTADSDKESFEEYDLRILTVFAQHASAAIENARLRLAELMVSVR